MRPLPPAPRGCQMIGGGQAPSRPASAKSAPPRPQEKELRCLHHCNQLPPGRPCSDSLVHQDDIRNPDFLGDDPHGGDALELSRIPGKAVVRPYLITTERRTTTGWGTYREVR